MCRPSAFSSRATAKLKESCFAIPFHLSAVSIVQLASRGPCVGVGQNPDSFSLVVGADGMRSQHSPFRIEPHRGQVSKDNSKSSNSEHWGVFHEYVSGLYLANDAGHFPPKAGSFAGNAGPFPGAADVLARKAARNDVNHSAPRSPVESANVIPDRERAKNSIVLALAQNPNGVGLPFNSANGSPPEQLAAEYSATSAREKCQLIHSSSVSPFDAQPIAPGDTPQAASA